MGKLKITQVRSTIGMDPSFEATMTGLGLRGIRTTSVLENRREVRGMVRKVLHLVKVEETNE